MKTNETTAPILAEKDRNAVSLELMNRMKLHGMAAAFTESLSSTFAEAVTPDSFLNWLLSREWDYRSEAAIQRLIRMASFRYKAYPEEIDYTISRELDRNQMERLASLEFVRQAQNLFITGSSGTGKSFLSTALGYQACKSGIRTFYANASKLLGALKVAKAKGTIEAELQKIERCRCSFWTTSSSYRLTQRSIRSCWTSSWTGMAGNPSLSPHKYRYPTGMTPSGILPWRMRYLTGLYTRHAKSN